MRSLNLILCVTIIVALSACSSSPGRGLVDDCNACELTKEPAMPKNGGAVAAGGVDEDGETGGASTTVKAWVEADSGGGYAEVPGSESRAHIAEAAAGGGLGTTFLVELAAAEDLRIRVEQSGTTDLSTAAGKSHLTFHRIRE